MIYKELAGSYPQPDASLGFDATQYLGPMCISMANDGTDYYSLLQ